MSRRLVADVVRVGGLTVLWVALWGGLTPANVLGGLVVAVAVLAVLPVGPREDLRLRPVAALRFAAHFTRLLVASTWEVVTIVVRPRPAVAEALVAVSLRTDSPTVATVVANSISLTPGTLTVEVTPRATSSGADSFDLLVHVLRLHDPDDIRATALDLEVRAAAALGATVPPTAPRTGGAP
ncbi:MAG: Na+/H+ antiporter subunit E [Acidimicrobiales bacterium]|nr:Na+/H+ antiporter subunit E [Acidimicrobiales bacterium]